MGGSYYTGFIAILWKISIPVHSIVKIIRANALSFPAQSVAAIHRRV